MEGAKCCVPGANFTGGDAAEYIILFYKTTKEINDRKQYSKTYSNHARAGGYSIQHHSRR
jgi:hypothetical protein